MAKEIVHLHWLWRKGPAATRGVTLGASLCGKFGLLPGQFTIHTDDANCPRCGELAAKVPDIGLPPEPSTFVKKKTEVISIASGTIKALTKRNPRRPGTAVHERMGLVLQHDGKTVKEFLDAGGSPVTLKYAINEKIVEVVK